MATRGKGILRIAIEDFFTTTKIGLWIASWFTQFGEWLEDAIAGHYQDILKDLGDNPDMPKSIRALAKGSGKGAFQGGILGSIGTAVGIGFQASGSIIAPLMKLGEYKANRKWKPARFDVPAAFSLIWRNPEQAFAMVSDLVDQGWSEDHIKAMAILLTPRANEQALVTYWLRGKISEADLNKELKARGYEESTIALFKELSQVIPPISDLIHMSVREAFSPEVVSRFQYDQGFPSDILQYTRKVGLSDEWVKRYWYAHWQLPSPQMGFEMLHRLRPGKTSNPFTKQDLDLLLRTADYAPYFRDKLVEISYTPFTRVDVRRMYKLGILSYDDVISAYMDIGYTEENAKRLADFTTLYETGDTTNLIDEYSDLSRSLVQSAYISGVISEDDFRSALSGMKITGDAQDLVVKITELKRQIKQIPDYTKEYRTDLKGMVEKAYTARIIDKNTALSMLVSLGIPDNQATMLLANADLNYTYGSRSEIINLIGKSYISRAIDRGKAIELLGKQNVSGTEQSQILLEWDNQRDFRIRRLSQSQYEKALLAGYISVDDYIEALRGLDYTDADIEILLQFAQSKISSE